LDDRLGIEITVENPEEWIIGNAKLPVGGNKVAGVTAQANPSTSMPTFTLRLTTVIEDDQGLGASAPKRTASPSKFARWRSADAKDHFQYGSVAPNSRYYTADGGNGTDPVVIRDDTAAARTHAEQLRAAKEFPILAGSVTIPFITDYYQIGDRVSIIEGRDASLQINIGADQGETPSYPWITALSWVLENNRQQTVLQLSDRRAEARNL
jgi:hypothetical protein